MAFVSVSVGVGAARFSESTVSRRRRRRPRTALRMASADDVPGEWPHPLNNLTSSRNRVRVSGGELARPPLNGRSVLSCAPALITVHHQGGGEPAASSDRHPTVPLRQQVISLGTHAALMDGRVQAQVARLVSGADVCGAALVARVDPSYVSWVEAASAAHTTVTQSPGGRPMSAKQHRRDEPLHTRSGRARPASADDAGEAPLRATAEPLASPFSSWGSATAVAGARSGHESQQYLYVDGDVTDAAPRTGSFHGPPAPECFAVQLVRYAQESGAQVDEQSSDEMPSRDAYCLLCSGSGGNMVCRAFRACFGERLCEHMKMLAQKTLEPAVRVAV